MASIECRKGNWRVIVRYRGTKKFFTIGEVTAAEAAACKTTTEELMRLIERHLLVVPDGCNLEDFLLYQGKPPAPAKVAALKRKEITLAELRAQYFASQEKKLEPNTLVAIGLHFNHLERILGVKQIVGTLDRADLQRYVEKRSSEWIDPEIYRRKRRQKAAAKDKKNVRKNARKDDGPERPRRHPSSVTIKKEIVSLRTAWNWARRQIGLAGDFPGVSLDYAKSEESLPFMTWDEAERRIAGGDDPAKVWECVYLRPSEVAELLVWVKCRTISPCVYPMLVFAAFTGARRSEIVRATPSDVDLPGRTITIREKKRDKKKLTTRRVPLTPALTETLATWMKNRPQGKTLFCKASGKPISPHDAHNYFQRCLRVSKWRVLKGWHVLRHSFCAALASKGVDQRIIDELMGHSTEQQRRRYRHLFPDVTNKAMLEAFG